MERCEECSCAGQPWDNCECPSGECCQDEQCPCYEDPEEG